MKVVIKVKKNISLKDLFNRRFTKIRRSKKYITKRVFLTNNIGISFIRDNSYVGKEDIEEEWVNQLMEIYKAGTNIEIVKELILRELQSDFRENKCLKNLLKDILCAELENEDRETTDIDINLALEEKLQEQINKKENKITLNKINSYKSIEFEYLLNKEYFYLIDEKRNVYILVNNKLYLLVKDLYFTVYKGELILSDEEITLKEYLSPIYKVNNEVHILDSEDYETAISYFQNNSTLHYQPKIKTKVEKTKFYSPSLLKVNSNVSFDEYINALEFTDYRKLVLTYKLLSEFKNDSCSEYECQRKHKENKDVYVGVIHSIRYIKEKDLSLTNYMLDGLLKFTYVKKIDILVIESLPKINEIYILNDAILKIILDMLYNVTDLENINEVHISNNLIGPVIISKSIIEKIPSLANDRHYELAQKSEEKLKEIYNNEISRRKALDLERKKARRKLVVSVNKAKDKYNDFVNINANGGVDLTRSITTKKSKNNEDYVIAYHSYRTQRALRYRRTHIIEAPEVIDIDKDNIDLKGFVISFPNGTKQIRNFSKNGDLNLSIEDLFYKALRNYSPYGEKVLFIVLPRTLDLKKFEFFKLFVKDRFIFISDDLQFIEQFRFLRLTYNKNCDLSNTFGEIKHCNTPIVYDPDIYDKIWGYRASSETLYEDLKRQIDDEVKRIEREKREVEEYRFSELKDFDYMPEIISEETTKRFIQGLTDVNLLETFISQISDIEILRVLSTQDLSKFYHCSPRNIINKIFFSNGKIKYKFMDIMLNDNELRNAINFNDFNRISFEHIQDLFNEYLYYFNNSKKELFKYIYKVFNELVNRKHYYELFYREEKLKSLSWFIGYIEKYKQAKEEITFYNFCELANEILTDEDLVESINRNDLLNNYQTIIIRLKNISNNISSPLVLYLYDLLKKSKIYFEVGTGVSKELIDELLKTYPYNEEYYKQLIEKYINEPRRILQLN